MYLGQQHGQQQIMDFAMIWLHRQGWDAEQITAFWHGVHELCDEYHDAFRVCMEQDIWQERMDAELRDALGDGFSDDFSERYGLVKTAGYDRVPREKNAAARRRGKKK